MPFRLLAYMLEIWRDILKNTPKSKTKRKAFKLPIIYPIVLYNGISDWTAPFNFKDMLHGIDLFDEQILDFKYTLIDVNRYEKQELLQLSNLISSVFLLDQNIKEVEELFIRLRELTDTINQLSEQELLLFKAWLKGIVIRRFPKKNHKDIEKVIDQTKAKEVGIMISNLEKNLERFIDESIEKGIEKRIEKGEKNTSIKIAKRMLLKGMSTDDIIELTKLTKEEIQGFKK